MFDKNSAFCEITLIYNLKCDILIQVDRGHRVLGEIICRYVMINYGKC